MPHKAWEALGPANKSEYRIHQDAQYYSLERLALVFDINVQQNRTRALPWTLYYNIVSTAIARPKRLGGGADDPLLRADIAKREKAEQAQKDKAQINKLSENRVEECLSSQAEENKNEMDQEKPSRQGSSGGDPGSEHFRDQDAESAEKALAKQAS